MLIAGGNLSWLNWLTIVLAVSTLDDRFLSWLPISKPSLPADSRRAADRDRGLAIVVAILSIPPTLNMLSPGQVMNTSFNPLQIVNTYGAFGSITRERYEIVIEGTDEERSTDDDGVAGVRVQGQAGRPGATAAAGRAVSSATRLADVVRGDVVAARLPVVLGAAAEAARRGPGNALAAPDQSFPGSPAALDPRAALPVPVHLSGGAPAVGPLVEPAPTPPRIFPP